MIFRFDPLELLCKLIGVTIAAAVLGGLGKAIGLIVALTFYSMSFQYWPKRGRRG